MLSPRRFESFILSIAILFLGLNFTYKFVSLTLLYRQSRHELKPNGKSIGWSWARVSDRPRFRWHVGRRAQARRLRLRQRPPLRPQRLPSLGRARPGRRPRAPWRAP